MPATSGPAASWISFGSFSGVLTGFYNAALVGIATFTTTLGDLDDVMVNGPVLRPVKGAEPEALTRRQYVSAMFGYLAFLALVVSFTAIFMVIGASVQVRVPWLPAAEGALPAAALDTFRWAIRVLLMVLMNVVLAHMFVTTCHGLYYLIDRLYEKKAVTLPIAPRPKRTSAKPSEHA